ncbi:putative NAD(P)/FAD-binding protein YdhS [Bradyrhizobium sp. USDA 3256]
MTAPRARHVIIIVGGGASGVLLAHQLLRQSADDVRVSLIEQGPDIGRGIAYHTGNPDHLLNVRSPI